MESRPVEVYPVHDYLRSRLCSLYENDSIFDRFECGWNGDDSYPPHTIIMSYMYMYMCMLQLPRQIIPNQNTMYYMTTIFTTNNTKCRGRFL